MKKKLAGFILALIFVLGLVVRIYKIDLPLADHHSWRQSDTAAVARNYIKEGYDFLHPRIDNMTYLQSPQLLNPERLFLTEPPLYNSLVYLVYRVGGVQEALARGVTIFFSLGSLLMVYLILERLTDRLTALLGAFFMAVLPYGIFYGRVILPEPFMVFLNLVWFWFLIRWLEGEKKLDYWLSILFGALSLTQKAFPFFLGLPAAALVLEKRGLKKIFAKKSLVQLGLMVGLIFLPVVVWRIYISATPEGIPPFDWLFNQGGIRFRPAFFRWIFAERIGKLILGYWGIPLFVLGLCLKPTKKSGWFFHWWLVAFLIYVTTLAAGNVTHDYYQIPFIPLAAIFLARGTAFLIRADKKLFAPWVSRGLALICVLLMLGFGWYEVRGFYNLQSGVDVAGARVQALTPPDALVLAADTNDSTLLYNCNRWGLSGGYASYFPNTSEHIGKAQALGVEYWVTTKVHEVVNTDFGQWLLTNHELVEQGDQYVIVKLRSQE